MAEEIGFKIKLDEGDAGKSVRNFMQDLKEAKDEAIAMGREFGAYSPEAIKAAAAFGELKDEIADIDGLAKSLTKENRFAAFAGFAGTIAGGFTAAQGALGLLSGDTKQFEKVLLKVQSAMALSQGLTQLATFGKMWQSLKGAVMSFTVVQKINTAATAAAVVVQKLFTGSVNATSKGFKFLKGAIISTGIGALIVALGYVISNFDKIKKAVMNLIPGLGSVAKFIGKIVDVVTDFTGITSAASRAVDKLKESIAKVNDVADKNIQLMEASGATAKEVRIAKNQMYDDEMIRLGKIYTLNGKLSDEERKRYNDLKFQKKLLKAEDEKAERDAAEAAKAKAKQVVPKTKVQSVGGKKEETPAERDLREKQEFIDNLKERNAFELDLMKAQGKNVAGQRQKNIDEEVAVLKENGGKFLDQVQKLEEEKQLIIAQAETDARAKKAAKDEEDKKAKEDNLKEQAQIADDLRIEGEATELIRAQEKYDAMKEVVKGNEELLKDVVAAEAEETANIRAHWDDVALQRKREQTGEYIKIGANLSDAVGKETAAGKGLAVATALMNTYQGATEALKQKSVLPSPFDVVAKIASVATIIMTGLRAVKSITAVNVPGAAGGSVGGAIPGGGSAPSVNAAPTMLGVQSTLLNKTNEIAGNKDALKAYVVESEITQKQERQRAITQTANF